MNLTLPLPPSANAYWRAIPSGKFCRILTSEVGREYKENAELLLKAQCREIMEGPIGVVLTVYFPNKRGDLDNRIKPTLDALQGVAIWDDKQIVDIHAKRLIDKDNPRVEITIVALP